MENRERKTFVREEDPLLNLRKQINYERGVRKEQKPELEQYVISKLPCPGY